MEAEQQPRSSLGKAFSLIGNTLFLGGLGAGAYFGYYTYYYSPEDVEVMVQAQSASESAPNQVQSNSQVHSFRFYHPGRRHGCALLGHQGGRAKVSIAIGELRVLLSHLRSSSGAATHCTFAAICRGPQQCYSALVPTQLWATMMAWYVEQRRWANGEVKKYADPPSDALLPDHPPNLRCVTAAPWHTIRSQQMVAFLVVVRFSSNQCRLGRGATGEEVCMLW